MYNYCMKTHKPKFKRVEIKIPKDLENDLLENLAPWHGIQKYAILAAIRNFAELPISEKLDQINHEVLIEKGGEES
jgi:hypothetical protein